MMKCGAGTEFFNASMKVPPKRKGNRRCKAGVIVFAQSLNESPSEKEGKYLSMTSWL